MQTDSLLTGIVSTQPVQLGLPNPNPLQQQLGIGKSAMPQALKLRCGPHHDGGGSLGGGLLSVDARRSSISCRTMRVGWGRPLADQTSRGFFHDVSCCPTSATPCPFAQAARQRLSFCRNWGIVEVAARRRHRTTWTRLICQHDGNNPPRLGSDEVRDGQ